MKLVYRLLNENDFDKGYANLINLPQLEKKTFISVIKDLTNTAYTIIYVCEDIISNLIIGTCTLQILPKFENDGRSDALLSDLYVHPKYENSLIKKDMVNFLIKLAIYKNCFSIIVITHSDTLLFHTLGMKLNKNIGYYQLILDDLTNNSDTTNENNSCQLDSED